jgi:hypothetical protein
VRIDLSGRDPAKLEQAAVRLTRADLPGMRERGWGRVQYIASDSAVAIPAEMVHDGVSETALLAVARGFAEEAAGSAASRSSCTRWSAATCRGTRPSGGSCASTGRRRCCSG